MIWRSRPQGGTESTVHRRPRAARAALAATVALTTGALLLAGCTGQEKPPKSAPGTPTSSSTTTDRPTTTPADGAMSPLGAHWDPSRTELWTDYLSTIPNTYTYYELVWCKMSDAPGQIDWKKVDKHVDYVNSLHITTTLKIRVGACWATEGDAQTTRGRDGKTESLMPKDLAAYASFVSEVVKRYSPKGVTEFALENEVNSKSYWGSSIAQFETMFRAGATAIRAANPAAKVVDAGMSSTTYGYGIADSLLRAGKADEAVAAWNRYYLRRDGTRGNQLIQVTSEADLRAQLDSEQGKRNLDYLALTTKLLTDKTADIRQIHYYEMPASVPDLLTYLTASTPSGVPVEAWEAGIYKPGGGDTVDSREQSDEMVQTTASLLAGGITKVIWLPLAAQPDNKKGEEIRGGLLTPQGGDRPTAHVFAELVKASQGAQITPESSATLAGITFTKDGKARLLLWARKGSASVTVPSGSSSNDLYAAKVTDGTAVEVGASPVLVTTTPEGAAAAVK